MKTILFCLIFPLPLLFSPSSLLEQDLPSQNEYLLSLSKPQILFRTAYNFFQTGAYEEAISTFHKFIADYPDHILLDYAHLYSGKSFMKTSQYKEAAKTFEQLQTGYPQSLLLPEVKFLVADNQYFQGKYETAIQQYLTLKKDKRYKKHRLLPGVYLKLGHCYEQKKQFRSARNIYHQARFTFISRPTYHIAKEREERLLAQHPSLRKYITTKEIFKDVDNLLKSGKAKDAVSTLTEFSEKKLSAVFQQQRLLKLAQAHYLLRENQHALELYNKFFTKYPKSKSIPYVLDRIGRLHLRRGDLAAFQEVYDRLRSRYPKSRYTAAAMRLKGKELEFQGNFKEALAEYNRFMKFFPKNSLIPDILWHIGWSNYQLQQYEAALKTLGRLIRAYPKSYHREEALYWAGRSAEQVQKYTQAADYYVNIINTTRNSYYGFLSQQALAQLKQQHPNLKLSQKSSELKPLELDQSSGYTTAQGILHQQKSKEFAQMRLYAQAAEELAYAIDRDTPNNAKYLELAQLYRQAGDYHQLIRLMQGHFWHWFARGDESLPQIFWELSYPLSFYHIVKQYTSSAELDPLFVLSLMFAESVFDPEAYSSAGAMGLMQLMPATGAKMANHVGIPSPSLEQYFRPEVNILLGTTYLKGLSQLFDGQLLPVIASYNAGEHVVSTWWNDRYRENESAFIASIPYQETKKYVQKVLWYYREYQRIYQQK